MSLWLIALLAGVAFAAVQYGRRDLRRAAETGLPALLRVAGVSLLVALLLDAPAGRARPLARWVALDASASWGRSQDVASWRAALRTARAARAESVFFFGDSLRPAALSRLADTLALPGDAASRVGPAVERALGRGHPLTVITDGELADAAALRELPGGSRITVLAHPSTSDLAVASLELPRAAVSGDTAEVRIGLAAGGRGAPAASLAITLGEATVLTVPLEALAPWAERTLTVRARLEGREGPTVVRAIVRAAGDAEPRNDTLAMAIDLSRAASAVFVSTSPDFDSRYALSVLRGALAVPTRGYFRVAPGAWRVDGSLAPVSEADVRGAFREAPVAILHGDTAVFGAPRSATAGPLALLVPAAGEAGEWYAASTPASPLAPALSGLPWDSLPPFTVGIAEPRGQWKALEARRGREDVRHVVIAGSDAPRRVVIVAASGLWRWRFRGGASSDAYTALWGSLFDWLAAERADRRAAVPAAVVVREGEPLRWQRGSAADSLVVVVLRRLSGGATDSSRADSLTLRFGAEATVQESRPMLAGIYRVELKGGSALVAVNASRELMPRPPATASGIVGAGALTDNAPRLRSLGWVYAVTILVLCAEWVARRRKGMR